MLMIESDGKGEALEVELIKAIEIEKVSFRPVTSRGRCTELLGFYSIISNEKYGINLLNQLWKLISEYPRI